MQNDDTTVEELSTEETPTEEPQIPLEEWLWSTPTPFTWDDFKPGEPREVSATLSRFYGREAVCGRAFKVGDSVHLEARGLEFRIPQGGFNVIPGHGCAPNDEIRLYPPSDYFRLIMALIAPVYRPLPTMPSQGIRGELEQAEAKLGQVREELAQLQWHHDMCQSAAMGTIQRLTEQRDAAWAARNDATNRLNNYSHHFSIRTWSDRLRAIWSLLLER